MIMCLNKYCNIPTDNMRMNKNIQIDRNGMANVKTL